MASAAPSPEVWKATGLEPEEKIAEVLSTGRHPGQLLWIEVPPESEPRVDRLWRHAQSTIGPAHPPKSRGAQLGRFRRVGQLQP